MQIHYDFTNLLLDPKPGVAQGYDGHGRMTTFEMKFFYNKVATRVKIVRQK
jgi:hypothetical protein